MIDRQSYKKHITSESMEMDVKLNMMVNNDGDDDANDDETPVKGNIIHILSSRNNLSCYENEGIKKKQKR